MPAARFVRLVFWFPAFFILSISTASAQLLEQLERELIDAAKTAGCACVRVDVARVFHEEAITGEGGKIKVRHDLPEISLSGVLLDSEGNVATLGEALVHASRVWVSVKNGKESRRFKAEVIGFSPESNVGLVRIGTGGPFKTLPLGDSDTVRQGAVVMGFGYTPNLEPDPSFTAGVVSATDRLFRMDRKSASTRRLIQTSLTIHPGETGGPVVNTALEVVGVLLTSYRPPAQTPESGRLHTGFLTTGYTLVLPINLVKKEMDWIIARHEKGHFAFGKGQGKPWLGLQGREIMDQTLRQQISIPHGGVLVSYVYPNDPAQQAGIVKNDVLKTWNRTPIMGADHLKELIRKAKVGDKVMIVLVRKGKGQGVEIRIGSF